MKARLVNGDVYSRLCISNQRSHLSRLISCSNATPCASTRVLCAGLFEILPGIFTQEGIAWKRSRELLRKQFVRAQYKNLNHFREHVDTAISTTNRYFSVSLWI